MVDHPESNSIRSACTAVTHRDWHSFSELLARGAVLRIPGRSGLSGEYRGGEAIVGFLGQLDRLWDTGSGFVAQQILTGDGTVVVVGRIHAQRPGRDLDDEVVCVLSLKDRWITEIRLYTDDQYRFDRFWS